MKLTKILNIIDDVIVLSKSMLSEESIEKPIQQTLIDLASLLQNSIPWALCGGIAVGVRAKPRGTEDIDILLKSDSEIDSIVSLTKSLFKHSRLHALTHKKYGVEVDLVTPEFVKVKDSIVLKVLETSDIFNLTNTKIPTVSAAGLIALKLGRASAQDIADIESIIKKHDNIDLTEYDLSPEQIKILLSIRTSVLNKQSVEPTLF